MQNQMQQDDSGEGLLRARSRYDVICELFDRLQDLSDAEAESFLTARNVDEHVRVEVKRMLATRVGSVEMDVPVIEDLASVEAGGCDARHAAHGVDVEGILIIADEGELHSR
jgi:hypothetical protein